ncbi:MAG: hypothetical protein HYV63_12050 [Candidatus Schekmanbacteria bacterium]|nr:hypothetical protein [Candidatus Schekmanbacteria bacterium]
MRTIEGKPANPVAPFPLEAPKLTAATSTDQQPAPAAAPEAAAPDAARAGFTTWAETSSGKTVADLFRKAQARGVAPAASPPAPARGGGAGAPLPGTLMRMGAAAFQRSLDSRLGSAATSPLRQLAASAGDTAVLGAIQARFQAEIQSLARASPQAFRRILEQALGAKASPAVIDGLLQAAARGELPIANRIAFADPARMGGADGAYVGRDGTVLLNRDLLDRPEALFAAFTEEAGHHLDALIGGVDAAGDEGQIFYEALAQRGPLAPEALARALADDDHGSLAMGEQTRDVEFRRSEGAPRARVAFADETARPDETLADVAARFYGDPAMADVVAVCNGITGPTALRDGQSLRLPRDLHLGTGSPRQNILTSLVDNEVLQSALGAGHPGAAALLREAAHAGLPRAADQLAESPTERLTAADYAALMPYLREPVRVGNSATRRIEEAASQAQPAVFAALLDTAANAPKTGVRRAAMAQLGAFAQAAACPPAAREAIVRFLADTATGGDRARAADSRAQLLDLIAAAGETNPALRSAATAAVRDTADPDLQALALGELPESPVGEHGLRNVERSFVGLLSNEINKAFKGGIADGRLAQRLRLLGQLGEVTRMANDPSSEFYGRIDTDMLQQKMTHLLAQDDVQALYKSLRGEAIRSVYGTDSIAAKQAEYIRGDTFRDRLTLLPEAARGGAVAAELAKLQVLDPALAEATRAGLQQDMGRQLSGIRDDFASLLNALPEQEAQSLLRAGILDGSAGAYKTTKIFNTLAGAYEAFREANPQGSTADFVKTLPAGSEEAKAAGKLEAIGQSGLLGTLLGVFTLPSLYDNFMAGGISAATLSDAFEVLGNSEDYAKLLGYSGEVLEGMPRLNTGLKLLGVVGAVGDGIGAYLSWRDGLAQFEAGDDVDGWANMAQAAGSATSALTGGIAAGAALLGVTVPPALAAVALAGAIVSGVGWAVDSAFGKSEAQELLERLDLIQEEVTPEDRDKLGAFAQQASGALQGRFGSDAAAFAAAQEQPEAGVFALHQVLDTIAKLGSQRAALNADPRLRHHPELLAKLQGDLAAAMSQAQQMISPEKLAGIGLEARTRLLDATAGFSAAVRDPIRQRLLEATRPTERSALLLRAEANGRTARWLLEQAPAVGLATGDWRPVERALGAVPPAQRAAELTVGVLRQLSDAQLRTLPPQVRAAWSALLGSYLQAPTYGHGAQISLEIRRQAARLAN